MEGNVQSQRSGSGGSFRQESSLQILGRNMVLITTVWVRFLQPSNGKTNTGQDERGPGII